MCSFTLFIQFTLSMHLTGVRKFNRRTEIKRMKKQTLIEYKRPFVLLKGNKKERLQEAVKHIDLLLKARN